MFHLSGIFLHTEITHELKETFDRVHQSNFPNDKYSKLVLQVDERLVVWCVCKMGKQVSFYKDSNVFITYSGFIFLTEETHLNISSSSSDILSNIANLYNTFGSKLANKIKGNYNLVIYSLHDRQLLLINDHLGFFKLYYHKNEKGIFFSSSLSFLIKSGLIPKCLNHSILLQKVIFNYPIVNSSFIDKVEILPPSSIFICNERLNSIQKYWSPLLLMNKPIETFKTGVPRINHILQILIDRYISEIKSFGLSLTGGWDGRLLLSYLIKNNFRDFFLYSFGAKQSKDITIPSFISKKEGLEYIPIFLEEEYHNSFQLKFSLRSAVSSEGLRNINLGHYIYAMSIICERTNNIISGNCGSNLLKTINSTGPIYNEYVKMLFEHKHLEESFIKIKSHFSNKFPFFHIPQEKWDSLFSDIQRIEVFNFTSLTKNQKFYYFLLNTIEGTYFGSEVSSYSDLVNNYSPFIDIDFLSVLSYTPYFGAHHDLFKKDHVFTRYMQSSLYPKLLEANSPSLNTYISDRGYAPRELLNFKGLLKVGIKRYSLNQLKAKRGHSHVYNYHEAFTKLLGIEEINELGIIKENRINYLNTRPMQNYKSFLLWFNSI